MVLTSMMMVNTFKRSLQVPPLLEGENGAPPPLHDVLIINLAVLLPKEIGLLVFHHKNFL
jgi:hypothetical protein